jgi:hypothetical protein
MYAHDIKKRDQGNIVNIEMLLFILKRKGSTKQMRYGDGEANSWCRYLCLAQ